MVLRIAVLLALIAASAVRFASRRVEVAMSRRLPQRSPTRANALG